MARREIFLLSNNKSIRKFWNKYGLTILKNPSCWIVELLNCWIVELLNCWIQQSNKQTKVEKLFTKIHQLPHSHHTEQTSPWDLPLTLDMEKLLEVAGSNAYGTALQGGSDIDLQVNCYFELSTISAGSPIIPLNSLNSPDMEQCVRAWPGGGGGDETEG